MTTNTPLSARTVKDQCVEHYVRKPSNSFLLLAVVVGFVSLTVDIDVELQSPSRDGREFGKREWGGLRGLFELISIFTLGIGPVDTLFRNEISGIVLERVEGWSGMSWKLPLRSSHFLR